MTITQIINELERSGYFPDELSKMEKSKEGIVFTLTNGDRILVKVNPNVKKSLSKGKIIKTTAGDELWIEVL
jgi:hypothetical protein